MIGNTLNETEKRNQLIQEMVEAGENYSQVARRFKVSRQRIHQIAVKNNFESPLSRQRIAQRNKKIVQLLQAGKSLKQISGELNISVPKVRDVARKIKFTFRKAKAK